ncbi:hypothetical protein [Caulobacter segnis]|uniref:hypothetical protein n=1 Tax=Caulobacter segnis TaxID=88688 RepID=UPI00285CA277|nr:hypothetical protein [Caulobacter segnis]MDR6625015.1 hypothetical protein [Caulobacter segnis]
MSQQRFPLQLDPELKSKASNLARSQGITLSQFINLAIAEKLARAEIEALTGRAENSARRLIDFLNNAPDQPPLWETDTIPPDVLDKLRAGVPLRRDE